MAKVEPKLPNGFKPYAISGRKNVYEILLIIKERQTAGKSLSLIRLGDGEGRILAYPEFVPLHELHFILNLWFNTANFTNDLIHEFSVNLRRSVICADIVGLPRHKQQAKHIYYYVIQAIQHFNLISDRHVITDSAIHHYLQATLLYREILWMQPFCGLIGPRNLGERLQEKFKIKEINQYVTAGESKFPGSHGISDFPDRFYQLKDEIKVPFPGAIFLVGAGALGKIYCQWIKERGGIAIDIGSMFDFWDAVPSRRRFELNPKWFALDAYDRYPIINLHESLDRFNQFCVEFGLDATQTEIPKNYMAHSAF